MIWSWFANAAMHVGMSDLSVFRFAKEPKAGWTTAAGIYVGHYMAWIAAALLYAVYLKSGEAQAYLTAGEAPPVAPGPLAYNAIGVFGIIAVILQDGQPQTLQSTVLDLLSRLYFQNFQLLK